MCNVRNVKVNEIFNSCSKIIVVFIQRTSSVQHYQPFTLTEREGERVCVCVLELKFHCVPEQRKHTLEMD